MQDILPVRISIGVLAHNEEKVIADTLNDLFNQSIFFDNSPWKDKIEVICIPNGCTDKTADIALNTINQRKLQQRLSASVCNLPEPGKANAWNVFVHELSANSAEFLMLVDSDISFGSHDLLEKLITSISNNPAVAVVSQAKKDVAKKSNRSFYENFLLRISSEIDQRCPGLAGSLYIARSSELRKTYLPIGLTVEDGFLRAMLLTDGFSKLEDCSKIILAPGAIHYFETLRDIRSIFLHEIRMVGGTMINTLLFQYITSPEFNRYADKRDLIRDKSASNSTWVYEYITQLWKKDGIRLIPKGVLFRRIHDCANKKTTPIEWINALLRTLVDWFFLLFVIARLRNGKLVGHW